MILDFKSQNAIKLSFYDSLIVASALLAKCGTLYSEDLQDGQTIDGRLIVRNPFTVRAKF